MTAEQLLAITEIMNKHTVHSINDGGTGVYVHLGQNACTRIFYNGSQEWLKDGYLHREDGPAVVCVDFGGEWYLGGEPMSQEEHAEWTKNITLSSRNMCKTAENLV